MYMLDTNICIYVINRRPAGVLRRSKISHPTTCAFPSSPSPNCTTASSDRETRIATDIIVNDFTSRLEVRPWDWGAALHYAQIRSVLEAKGTPIGNMDPSLIATQGLLFLSTVLLSASHGRMSTTSHVS